MKEMRDLEKKTAISEFSRLGGYSRNGPIMSNRNPAVRLSTQGSVRWSRRISDAEPPRSMSRPNIKAYVAKEAEDISSRSPRGNSEPPKISRRKEVKKCRDDLQNQLKIRGSPRTSSKMRPHVR